MQARYGDFEQIIKTTGKLGTMGIGQAITQTVYLLKQPQTVSGVIHEEKADDIGHKPQGLVDFNACRPGNFILWRCLGAG